MSNPTASRRNAETLAHALGGRKTGDGWVARCPAHKDQKPSLSIQEKHGKVLVHCFAGCHQDNVLDALRQRGLWPAEPQADVRQVCRPPSLTVSSQPPGRSPQALWDGYSPVSPSHPYLTRKRIGTHGARAAPGQSTLAIPLTDMAGAVYGLQSISADGTKKFLPGSKVTGHFFLIGDPSDSITTCCIAEGFATAASIHEAMGGLAVVAFNAGNLRPVAEALRRQWPDRPLVLCADDDAKTSGNPGLAAARSAAQAVGGAIAVPDFGADRPDGATDFNDLAISQGSEAVRNSIQGAFSAFPALDNLVAMTMENPGHPFQPDVAAELGTLSTADPARFEMLRAELKERTQCRVTQLDRFLRGGSQNSESGGGSSSNASNMANRLVAIAHTALNGWEGLFLSTQDHQAFADLMVTGHRETWPVDSDYFRHWLTEQCAEQTSDTPGSEALNAAVNRIWAKARFGGQRRPAFIRCGAAEDRLYLDLCDEAWRCIEISKEGWRALGSSDSPVRFRRYLAMDALPEPARGGAIEALRPFVNVASDEDFVLLVAWLLAALRSHGPYPVLVLSGEPGSAKSTVAKILRSLADPSHIPARVFPDTDEDIFLDASHSHLLVFDNLSSLSPAASDLLCQLATGGGFGRRQLYSNQEEFLLHASRPILLNGIENVAVRSDLADRAVCLTLEPVAEEDRRPESELWANFEVERPRILGALLDAMVVGLNRLPDIRLPETPRMADFACWVAACETACWPEGTFSAIYAGNRQDAMEDVVSSDPVAESIWLLVSSQSWEGTASELLSALESIAGERVAKSKRWPNNAQILSRSLKRIAPALRRVGVEVSYERRGRGREKRKVIWIAGSG